MIKIGSILCVLLSVCAHLLSGAPFLRLVLPSGEQVSHIAAQQPAVLELVTDQPVHRVATHQAIAPFVSHTSQASSYKNINGVASREYIHRWHLTFPKPHVLTVGPLSITTDSGQHQVPELIITIVPANDHAPMARIEYDQQSVVAGEWSSASILFVVPAGAPCNELSFPAHDSVTVRVDTPQRSRIIRSGKPMDEIRYRVEWMAKAPGSFTLGPARIAYALQPQGIFGFFGRFTAEQVPLATDIITILVDPLPPHHQPVHAVGDIKKVFIKTAHAECARGSALSVDLCIVGACTLLCDPAELLPSTDAYSVYPSHHEQVPGAIRSVYTVKLERDGAILCSMVDFVFFNTRTRKYETIAGEPLALHGISPATAESASLEKFSPAEVVRDSNSFFRYAFLLILLIVVGMVSLFVLRPLSLLYQIRRSINADLCAQHYGALCALSAQSKEPYDAAQKLLDSGAAPLDSTAARWYLEQRYAAGADWRVCRDAARRTSAIRCVVAYASMRMTKKMLLFVALLMVCGAIYYIFAHHTSYERCLVAQGTPLYYLPKNDPALCVGSVAADGEAVILEKRDQWIFIRCAVQRGWVDCSESATPGD